MARPRRGRGAVARGQRQSQPPQQRACAAAAARASRSLALSFSRPCSPRPPPPLPRRTAGPRCAVIQRPRRDRGVLLAANAQIDPRARVCAAAAARASRSLPPALPPLARERASPTLEGRACSVARSSRRRAAPRRESERGNSPPPRASRPPLLTILRARASRAQDGGPCCCGSMEGPPLWCALLDACAGRKPSRTSRLTMPGVAAATSSTRLPSSVFSYGHD